MYKNKKEKYTAVFFILSIIIFTLAVIYNSISDFMFGLNDFNLIFLLASGFVFWIGGAFYIKFSDDIAKR